MSRERRGERRRRMEESRNHGFSRRDTLKYGLPAVGIAAVATEEFFYGLGRRALAGIADRFSGEHYVTFEEAQRDPSKREQYVKDVVRRFGLLELVYLDRVSYCSEPPKEDNNEIADSTSLMQTEHTIGDIGKKIPHRTTIYPIAFDSAKILTEGDFLSVLIDHETEGHAKPIYFGYEGIDVSHLLADEKNSIEPLYTDVGELYAFRNQIKNASGRRVSPANLRNMDTLYWMYYSDLIHPIRNNDVKNPNELKKLREMFFSRRFLTDPIKTPRGYQGPIAIENGKMMTWFGWIELPDYLQAKVDQWRKEAK
ncbi:MAG TPA: hypothetical protein VJB06_02670 [archaeon]|nr:hypothetical protein [archaeon]